MARWTSSWLTPMHPARPRACRMALGPILMAPSRVRMVKSEGLIHDQQRRACQQPERTGGAGQSQTRAHQLCQPQHFAAGVHRSALQHGRHSEDQAYKNGPAAVNAAATDKTILERFSALGFQTAPASPEALAQRPSRGPCAQPLTQAVGPSLADNGFPWPLQGQTLAARRAAVRLSFAFFARCIWPGSARSSCCVPSPRARSQ